MIDIPVPTIETPFDFSTRNKTKLLPFRQFIKQVNPRYKFHPYLNNLIDLLQQVADNKITRLMVFMPPRHGKSELVSRLFPAYYLLQHPKRWTALVSYGAELANSLSRNARDNYLYMDGQLKSDAATIKNWETGKGGGLWATGIGGSATGKGFNLGIIDDPVKDAAEAYSGTIKRRNEDWYNSVFWTRREPVNAVVIVSTRWGKNDLSGYIIDSESDNPEHWTIVHNEAIKQNYISDYPDTCKIIEDNRQVGEALSPDWPIDELEKIKAKNLFWFNALYQQSPKRRQGRVYYSFSDINIGPDASELDYTDASFYHSHDFGAVNHVYGIYAKISDRYYKIHEERLPEMTTQARADVINAHLSNCKVVAGWGGASSERQYRMDFQQAGLSIRQPPMMTGNQDGTVEAQIRQVNTMFEKQQLYICSNCTMTLDQLENCVRDEKGGIADKASWHFLDETRYFGAGIMRSGWGR